MSLLQGFVRPSLWRADLTLRSPSERRKILVAIPTYRRNEMLERLLDSLNKLAPPANADVSVVVIDNDKSGFARPVVEKWKSLFSMPLVYEMETAPGVTHVRNHALKMARDFDLLAFIDDDEFADPEWLAALVARYDETNAAAVFGPVWSIYPESTPQWMRDWNVHAIEITETRDRKDPGGSGNSLIDMHVVRKLELTFDARLSKMGGEDTLFFYQMQDEGYRLTQTKDASVYEHVPQDRARVGWLFRRWYRYGITDALITSRHNSLTVARLKAVPNGLIRIGIGALLVTGATVATLGRNKRAIYSQFFTLCRGFGMLTFALGGSYEEYGSALTRPQFDADIGAVSPSARG